MIAVMGRARPAPWRMSLALVLLAGCGAMAFAADGASVPAAAVPAVPPGTATAPAQFPPGPGQPQVQQACGPCHAITIVTAARKSEVEWERTVNAMITRGARVSDDDYDAILDYLIANFSPP